MVSDLSFATIGYGGNDVFEQDIAWAASRNRIEELRIHLLSKDQRKLTLMEKVEKRRKQLAW
jgi:hypothetical protein